MRYQLLLLKRIIEDILMFPFVLLGRFISLVKPMPKEYQTYYFFPFYHTGGAEKIHALITKTTAKQNSIIFFTRKSHNQTFLRQFQESGCEIKDISTYTDNKWLYVVNIIFRGIISGYINRQKVKPVIFNGQCNFGYKISPWIRKEIKQIELIHSLNSFSYIRIPFLPFITTTVMISERKIQEHFSLYKRFGIPSSLFDKINYIPNASDFEEIQVQDKDFSKVRVFYSGRATPEKRPHLVTSIAEEVHQIAPDIEFIMAGDDFTHLKKPTTSFIQFRGNIKDSQELKNVYCQCNALLITSSTEGFPLAIIEGMAYGCAILATPVGDIPVHVQTGENGYLFSTIEDEKAIIKEGVASILSLKEETEKLKKISETNITYAKHNFTLQKFGSAYQKLIYS